MEKEYNEWYWKLYRWFKWELPLQGTYFIIGIKNIWRWFWVIWKDRDWDHHFYCEVSKKKLSQIRDLHKSNDKFVNSSRDVEKINLGCNINGWIGK